MKQITHSGLKRWEGLIRCGEDSIYVQGIQVMKSEKSFKIKTGWVARDLARQSTQRVEQDALFQTAQPARRPKVCRFCSAPRSELTLDVLSVRCLWGKLWSAEVRSRSESRYPGSGITTPWEQGESQRSLKTRNQVRVRTWGLMEGREVKLRQTENNKEENACLLWG